MEKLQEASSHSETQRTAWDDLAKESLSPHDREILSSDAAKNILPYLTITQISESQQANLIELSEQAISRAKHPNDKDYDFDALDYYRDYLGQQIANIAGEGKNWSDGYVGEKTCEARKIFCAALLNQCNLTENPHLREAINFTFFKSYPNFTSYCGEVPDSLELLTISNRSKYNPCTLDIYETVIFDSTMSDENWFERSLEHATPLKQLRLLPIIFNTATLCYSDSWETECANQALEALYDLSQEPTTAPLVRLVASNLQNQAQDNFSAEWVDRVDIDMFDPEYAYIIQERKEREERIAKDKKEQALLHKSFPNLPTNYRIVKIAPDIAATINNSQIDYIENTSGESASILKYAEKNPFGIDRDTAFLLSTAHDPDISPIISEKLGLELSDIPLDSQVQLLKFMTTPDNSRFDKLCNTLNKLNPDLRLKLAESFLAADFGEDFGDSLLEIADSKFLSPEQINNILDNVDSSRRSIKEITSLFQHFNDKEFQNEYSRAANERLTDAITVFKEIAKTGKAKANLGWAGKINFTYDTALEALKYETSSLEVISNTIKDVIDGKDGSFAEKILRPSEQRERSMYNFYSPDSGYVLLYTRPEGSGTFDQAIEYGKARNKYNENSRNAGVEASISFIVNPVDPMNLPSPFRPNFQATKNPNFYDPITMDKVSALRLDREGRAPDAPADDPDRDPINPIGTISVDLAAINDRADTPSGKIARLFSVGNKLRMGDNYSLNHNTNWFNQEKYGIADGFKNLVDYIDTLANIWCAQHPPKPSDQSFTATFKAANSTPQRAA